MTFARRLEVQAGWPRWLLLCLCVPAASIPLLVLMLVFQQRLAGGWYLLAQFLAVWSLWQIFRQQKIQRRYRLRIRRDHSLELLRAGRPVELESSRFIRPLPALVFARLRLSGGRSIALVFARSLNDSDIYRQFLVYIRWGQENSSQDIDSA